MKLGPSGKRGARRRRPADERIPVVELSDTGLYLRMAPGRPCARTIANGRWPHLAVDFDRRGRVIGLEAIPLPDRFSLGRLARLAGVRLSAHAIHRARIQLKFAARADF